MIKETKQPSTPESKNDTQAEQNIVSAPQAAPEASGTRSQSAIVMRIK